MPSPLEVLREVDGDGTRITLKGNLTEEAELQRVGPLSGRVVFDVGQLRRVNSTGVREWIEFLRTLPPEGELEFVRCSPPFLAQVNMIANFLGGGRIRSVYAPYVCEACNAPAEVLLEVGKDVSSASEPAPAQQCPKCGQPLVFDDVEETYFSFLS